MCNAWPRQSGSTGKAPAGSKGSSAFATDTDAKCPTLPSCDSLEIHFLTLLQQRERIREISRELQMLIADRQNEVCQQRLPPQPQMTSFLRSRRLGKRGVGVSTG